MSTPNPSTPLPARAAAWNQPNAGPKEKTLYEDSN
jgi:hypothetical protein